MKIKEANSGLIMSLKRGNPSVSSLKRKKLSQNLIAIFLQSMQQKARWLHKKKQHPMDAATTRHIYFL